MQVFICDISNVSDALLEKAATFLSASEKERLNNMISVKRQREFIAGHYLLRRLLSQSFKSQLNKSKLNLCNRGHWFLLTRI